MSEAAAWPGPDSPFECIRNRDRRGRDCWKSCDLARIPDSTDYRNFLQVVEKAKLAYLNSGGPLEYHVVDANEMVEAGSGANRRIDVVLPSGHALQVVSPPCKLSSEVALGA